MIKKENINETKSVPVDFEVGQYDVVQLRSGTIRFKSLYNQKSLWKRYSVAIVTGIIMAIIGQLMIKNTGLYNSGLSALIQGIARITNTAMLLKGVDETITKLVFNLLFWIFYAIANIPLFIFGYKKIGKTFAKLTFVFVVVNSVVGFSLSYIPGIDNVFIFGNTIAEGYHHSESQAMDIPNIFVAKGINNIPFWYEPKGSDLAGRDVIFNQDYDPYKGILFFIYAIVYGLISSFVYSMLYIVGGCSAGGDFVSIYYSSIKHKPLGGLMIVINSSCLLLGSIIGSYISAGMVNSQGFNFPFLLSANLVASFLYVVIFGMCLNRFFPLHKLVKVEIMSQKLFEVRDELFASKFTHSMSITKNKGAYTMKEKDVLWTVCMYVEVPNLIRHIRKTDPNAFILVSSIQGLDGKIRIYRQGSTES